MQLNRTLTSLSTIAQQMFGRWSSVKTVFRSVCILHSMTKGESRDKSPLYFVALILPYILMCSDILCDILLFVLRVQMFPKLLVNWYTGVMQIMSRLESCWFRILICVISRISSSSIDNMHFVPEPISWVASLRILNPLKVISVQTAFRVVLLFGSPVNFLE